MKLTQVLVPLIGVTAAMMKLPVCPENVPAGKSIRYEPVARCWTVKPLSCGVPFGFTDPLYTRFAPASPGSPCGPVGPTAPVGPCAPVAPVAPARPVAPVAPVAPAGPVGPCVPVAPVAPVAPAKPVAPVAPVAPATPVAPVAPVAPMAPVAPVSPLGPGGPTTFHVLSVSFGRQSSPAEISRSCPAGFAQVRMTWASTDATGTHSATSTLPDK